MTESTTYPAYDDAGDDDTGDDDPADDDTGSDYGSAEFTLPSDIDGEFESLAPGSRGSAAIASLRARAALLRQVRRFFDDGGFTEVQPPCLSSDQIVDAHIDPIEVAGRALLLPHDQAAERYYLQSSPELQMKRMLAAGSGPIYSLGPAFRAGERSPRHNIEFTMLEWYDIDVGVDRVIDQTIALVTGVLPNVTPLVVTYRQLFRDHLGFDPIDEPLDSLIAAVAGVDAELATGLRDRRDELLDVLLTEVIEPRIGDQSVLIRNYPLSQAALAQPSSDDPQTADRFEWIIRGLELANGYGELLDADELIRRGQRNNDKRRHSGRRPLPVESRLLAAMRHGLPPCAGVALGFDRLLMLSLGSDDIAAVLPFPIEQA